MFVIYRAPVDVPDAPYVVRRWDVDAETGTGVPVWARVAPSLPAARKVVPPEANRCLPRAPGDDPCIVETWI